MKVNNKEDIINIKYLSNDKIFKLIKEDKNLITIFNKEEINKLIEKYPEIKILLTSNKKEQIELIKEDNNSISLLNENELLELIKYDNSIIEVIDLKIIAKFLNKDKSLLKLINNNILIDIIIKYNFFISKYIANNKKIELIKINPKIINYFYDEELIDLIKIDNSIVKFLENLKLIEILKNDIENFDYQTLFNILLYKKNLINNIPEIVKEQLHQLFTEEYTKLLSNENKDLKFKIKTKFYNIFETNSLKKYSNIRLEEDNTTKILEKQIIKDITKDPLNIIKYDIKTIKEFFKYNFQYTILYLNPNLQKNILQNIFSHSSFIQKITLQHITMPGIISYYSNQFKEIKSFQYYVKNIENQFTKEQLEENGWFEKKSILENIFKEATQKLTNNNLENNQIETNFNIS